MRSFLSALAVLPAVHVALADESPYTGFEFQDKDYGLYPTQHYVSSDIQAPIFQVNVPAGNNVDPASHVFISPRGKAVTQSAPMVFNSDDLSLVWSNSSYGQSFGVRVQEYNNTDYITFWRGTVKSTGYGSGSYVMLDSNYNVAFNLTAMNVTVGGDIHEIQLTDQGTALMTVYEPMPFDLTGYGIENGWLADSLFQEVDVATNELIFSWRASDHFNTNTSYADPGTTGISADSPYDFFHINSVQKDDSGNYLISARHCHVLAYINGTNGDVIWQLGGKNNDFEDKSGGNATNFSWQHDARWQTEDLTEVTIFDNGAADWTTTEPVTRGLWLKLDYSAMTATLKQDYLSPESISSVSQGSVQVLHNKNIFMGYGSNGAFIEYANDGTVVWDVQFGIVGNSSVQSYRAYKQNWTGFPKWKPSIAATGNATDNSTIYLSWNGATEIKNWVVLASNETSDLATKKQMWKQIEKKGFETKLQVGTYARYARATALDADGKVLGSTDIVDLMDGSVSEAKKDVDIGSGIADSTVSASANNDDDDDDEAGGNGSSGGSGGSIKSQKGAAGSLRASASLALGVVVAVLGFVWL